MRAYEVIDTARTGWRVVLPVVALFLTACAEPSITLKPTQNLNQG